MEERKEREKERERKNVAVIDRNLIFPGYSAALSLPCRGTHNFPRGQREGGMHKSRWQTSIRGSRLNNPRISPSTRRRSGGERERGRLVNPESTKQVAGGDFICGLSAKPRRGRKGIVEKRWQGKSFDETAINVPPSRR